MPLLLLLAILANLFTIGFIWLDVYLVREWYLHKDLIQEHYGHEYAQYCLIAAIVLTIFVFSGKTLIKLIFSKRKPGEVEPTRERYQEQYRLERPDGSVINVEHGGVKGKQTIVFIHGWNSNSTQWFYQKRFFEKDYH